MYSNNGAPLFSDHQEVFGRLPSDFYLQQIQHTGSSAHNFSNSSDSDTSIGLMTEYHRPDSQSVDYGKQDADLACYGLQNGGDFLDVNSLEPSIGYSNSSNPAVIGYNNNANINNNDCARNSINGAQYRLTNNPVIRPIFPSYHGSSPTGSSHASTGSEEGSDDAFLWHPYKRHSPPHGMVMAADMSNGLLDSPCNRNGATQNCGKPTKKRKPKRDPNEPQKPVSAYALFFRDTQAAIKGQNPNASFGEISKIVASEWDRLETDAKNSYKQRQEIAKKDYLKQLAAYRSHQLIRSGGNPGSIMDAMAQRQNGCDQMTASPGCSGMFGVGGVGMGGGSNYGHTPDSSTNQSVGAIDDPKEATTASDIGARSLASLIAEPTPHQVLTATTTLTLRNKNDYDGCLSSPFSNHHQNAMLHQQQQQHQFPLCVSTQAATNDRWEQQQQQQQQPQTAIPNGMSQRVNNPPQLTSEFKPPQGLVQHCRDVFTIWGEGESRQHQTAAQGPLPGYQPV